MQFEIKNRVIKSKTQKLIICDNADYVAHFSFDEEWEGVTKTARFISCKGEHKDVLLENNECLVPCEVLKCGYARVGVYSAEMTTTECEILVVGSIKDEEGCECEPTPSVYEQLTGKLDDIQAQLPNEVETQVTGYFEEHKEEFKGDKGERGEAGAVKFIPVNELPTENIELDAIYLKPVSDPKEKNKYEEYVYTNGAWECIGTASVSVDMDGYVTIEEYNKLYNSQTKKLTAENIDTYDIKTNWFKAESINFMGEDLNDRIRDIERRPKITYFPMVIDKDTNKATFDFTVQEILEAFAHSDNIGYIVLVAQQLADPDKDIAGDEYAEKTWFLNLQGMNYETMSFEFSGVKGDCIVEAHIFADNTATFKEYKVMKSEDVELTLKENGAYTLTINKG